MKAGDYVRTKNGKLAKIIKIDFDDEEQKNICIFDKEIIPYYEYTTDNCYKEEVDIYIVKSSPKIISLIQVGDYVNGYKVIDFMLENGKTKGIIVDGDIWGFDIDEINSIVTKEFFESMEYKVKE